MIEYMQTEVDSEKRIAAVLNEKAAHGWRFVAFIPSGSIHWAGWLILSREVEGEIPA